MDGVLADFDKRAFETFGRRFDDFPTSQEAWDSMVPYQNFYRNLEKMPDADQLVEGVGELAKEFKYSTGILTAIPKMARFPTCTQDKMDWLGERWPHLLEDFNTGPYSVDKQNYAGPTKILIDDRAINIAQWIEKGGYGIHHISAEESLRQLRTILHTLHFFR